MLRYSIFRYTPNLICGEYINLAAVLYSEEGYREFYCVPNLDRLESFDSELLNIPMIQAMLDDLRDSLEEAKDVEGVERVCGFYHNEFGFGKFQEAPTFVGIRTTEEQAAWVKRMYFPAYHKEEKRA